MLELLAVQRRLDMGVDRDHVGDLVDMAFRAANMKDATIVFTPFSRS